MLFSLKFRVANLALGSQQVTQAHFAILGDVGIPCYPFSLGIVDLPVLDEADGAAGLESIGLLAGGLGERGKGCHAEQVGADAPK